MIRRSAARSVLLVSAALILSCNVGAGTPAGEGRVTLVSPMPNAVFTSGDPVPVIAAVVGWIDPSAVRVSVLSDTSGELASGAPTDGSLFRGEALPPAGDHILTVSAAGFGLTAVSQEVLITVLGRDEDGDGVTVEDGDCDDENPAIFPGAEEVCDGADSDCDGDLMPEEEDLDGDGVGGCLGDCNEAAWFMHQGHPEVCDGFDNDCNGTADDGVSCTSPCNALPRDANRSIYRFCTDATSWSDAAARCAVQGMRLADIRGSGENDFVRTWAGPMGTSVWLGGTDQAVPNEWLWPDGTVFWTGLADGSASGFANWLDGEPNDSSGVESCTEMNTPTGQWNDLDCGTAAAYVCEYP